MKKIIGIVSIVAMMLTMAFSANAAQYSLNGNAKAPTSISYKDISRLVEVASSVKGSQAKVVNAMRYNGSNTTWIVRLSYGAEGANSEDFVLTTYPYVYDMEKKQVTSLPFKNVEEGTQMFGPSWMYFGLFGDNDFNSCGFCVAERIKRWPKWNDLSFNGTTKKGITYKGSYAEPCSSTFLEDHMPADDNVTPVIVAP